VGSWDTTLENRAVDAYLLYLTTGELPPPPNIDARLELLDTKLANETRMFVKVQLVQEKRDLTAPIATPEALEEAFVKHAGGFSERNRITYVTWREMGVPANVLKRAGLGAGSKQKLAPDDPKRMRPYIPRRTWSDEEKAEYIAYYEANGTEATVEHYGATTSPSGIKQRYYSFRADLRAKAGEPPLKRGRPRKAGTNG
jgi:hypothetical protein